MHLLEWIFGLIGLLCPLIGIGVAFYLGKNKIKDIDRLVYGFEIADDSIFFYGLRLMNYGGAFAWRLGAKRSKLIYLREKFDKKFQRPFIIYFYLMVSGGFSAILLFILSKFYL